MTVDEKVKNIILKLSSIDLESYSPDKGLKNHLGIDSLDLVELIVSCEREFNIIINDTEISLDDSTEKVIQLVKSKMPSDAMTN